MSTRNEQAFWEEIKREHKHKPIFSHVERVENRVNTGMADVYWAAGSTERHGWLELKHMKQESKTKRIGLRPAQAVWHEQINGRGNFRAMRSHILLKVGETYCVWWGTYARILLENPYSSATNFGYVFDKEQFYDFLRKLCI